MCLQAKGEFIDIAQEDYLIIPCPIHNHYSLLIVAHPELLLVPRARQRHPDAQCCILQAASLAGNCCSLALSMNARGSAYTCSFAMFHCCH